MTGPAGIWQYVMEHTDRGECKCGSCPDGTAIPHTVDMRFFKTVVRGQPDAVAFLRLSGDHRGEFAQCDPFDGKPHNYVEIGGWIGDRSMALQYMALGRMLGLFNLMATASGTPVIVSARRAA